MLQVDTVRAYYSGPRLLVEVDVVMDADAALRLTHDVAEDLQIKLESLPDVERAFVHVDYEVTHKPVSFGRKMRSRMTKELTGLFLQEHSLKKSQ